MNLKIKKLDPTVKLPEYKTAGAAGFDIHAHMDRTLELGPGQRATIPTGLSFEIPEGFEIQIRPRSGLQINHGVLGLFGTIDSDYRGEVKIGLINTSRMSVVIGKNDRVAQGVLAPVTRALFEEVETLTKTERGTKGFGSTGV